MPVTSRVPSAPFRIAAILAGAVLVTACQPQPGPGGNGGATTGPSPAATQPGPSATGGGAAPLDPEANVITGRVTTKDGRPIPTGSLRIVGYTGGASLGQEIETVTTGGDGTYRYEVPRGLYEVLGQATLDFGGQTYLFDLDPADGSCDQEMSDSGIVKDFVLSLTGPLMCQDGVNPDNYLAYHGATVQLFNRTTAAPHEVVEYLFQPSSDLADGSPAQPLTMQRTIAAHTTSAGPLDDTWVLYDIPLAEYVVSAALIAPDGSRQPLLLSTDAQPTPGQSVDLSFAPRIIVGTLGAGYVIPNLTVQEGG